MKSKFKGYLGIIFIVLGLIMAYFWETQFKQDLLYEEVIVLKENIEKNTVITEDMLTIVEYEKKLLIDGAIQNKSQVIGTESKHFIPAKTQLHQNYFGDPDLLLNEKERYFKIPSEWVVDYPSTIMRGDTIYFYPIKGKDSIGNDLSKPIIIETSDGEMGEGLLNSPIFTKEQNIKPILKSKVAYVKDNANREVIYTNDRKDASSIVSSIVLVVTTEQVELLKKHIYDGYKFILLYDER